LKVHLFGLPLSTHRRLEQESNDWVDAVPPGHEFSSTPISTNERAPFSSNELKDLKAKVGHGYTHVIIPASRHWEAVAKFLQFDCRVHVARLWEPIRDVNWADLKEALHAAVKLDEKWLAKIAPADVRHALLLPPKFFSPVRDTEAYWYRCDVYQEAKIPAAEKLLSLVEREHRKQDGKGGRSWIDQRNLRYRVDPSKHALSVAARSGQKDFRFCYEVMPGFHYDVHDDADRSFVIDIGGKSETVNHCNVTPWGHVRKG
jgi:hypothetical protein